MGFRFAAQAKAEELGVFGWVRNLEDGRVEIHGEGEETVLEQYIRWCRKGPLWAKVTAVDIQEVPVTGVVAFTIADNI